MIAGLMLVAFCSATIIFQNISLKSYYSLKAQQKGLVGQSLSSPLGLMEEENQTTGADTLEEDSDEFTAGSIFSALVRCEVLTLRYVLIQEQLFKEHHPEIVSPPPKA